MAVQGQQSRKQKNKTQRSTPCLVSCRGNGGEPEGGMRRTLPQMLFKPGSQDSDLSVVVRG